MTFGGEILVEICWCKNFLWEVLVGRFSGRKFLGEISVRISHIWNQLLRCLVNYLQMIFSPEYDNSCNRSRRVQNLIKSSSPNAKHLSILFWSRLENQNIVLICVHWPQLLGDLIIILLLVLFSQSSDHCLSKGPLWFSELLQLHGEGWAQGSWLEEAQPSMLQVVGGGSSLRLMVSWLSWQAAPRRRSTEDRRCSEWGKGRWVKIGRQGKERG